MSDPLRDGAAGQPSPFINRLDTVNGVLEAARGWRAQRKGTLGNEVVVNDRFPATYCRIRNDTGGNLNALEVVALGAPVISAVDLPQSVNRTPVFAGTVPAAATDVVAVLVEPVKYDEIGIAVVLGLAVVDLAVTDAAHTCAAPAAGVTATLASAASGPARIIWKETGTGTKRAVVLLGRDTAAANTPPDPSTGTAVSCGWLAGLLSSQCLTLTVLGATGRCADIDDTQELTLVYDTGTWVSETDFTHDGGTGPVVFSVTADGLPKLTIDGVVGILDGCGIDGDENHYADWAFGGTTLCDGTPGECGTNIFRVRLTCGACPPPDPCCDDRPMPAELICTVTSDHCAPLNKVITLVRTELFSSPGSFVWMAADGCNTSADGSGIPVFWVVECDGSNYQLRLTPQNLATETLTLSYGLFGLTTDTCDPYHLTFTVTSNPSFFLFNPAGSCGCSGGTNPTTVTIDIVE